MGEGWLQSSNGLSIPRRRFTTGSKEGPFIFSWCDLSPFFLKGTYAGRIFTTMLHVSQGLASTPFPVPPVKYSLLWHWMHTSELFFRFTAFCYPSVSNPRLQNLHRAHAGLLDVRSDFLVDTGGESQIEETVCLLSIVKGIQVGI